MKSSGLSKVTERHQREFETHRRKQAPSALNHIFQGPFLRIENSKLNLSTIVSSLLCQMIFSTYLHTEHKQLKMFTLRSNGSHVSNAVGGWDGEGLKLSPELKLEDIQ